MKNYKLGIIVLPDILGNTFISVFIFFFRMNYEIMNSSMFSLLYAKI